MSTPYTKAALKKARAAIQEQDWEAAASSAQDVLEYEADNYNARVFCGLALLHLGKFNESESAYRKAIKSSPAQILAWQGLSSFYEKRQQWEDHAETLRTIAQLQYDAVFDSKDSFKCAEALRKLIECQREHGSRTETIDTLSLLLPSSPFYDLLSTLPEPEPTAPTGSSIYEIQQLVHNSLPILTETIAAVENEESRQIKAEIERRRMRLTSGSATETRRLVEQEVLAKSRLPDLYRQILEHPAASDEIRRDSEFKWLLHLKTLLFALPDPFEVNEMTLTEAELEERARNQKKAGKAKDNLRAQVEDLSKGLVLLRLPTELAWRVVLDWLDVRSVDEYPLTSLLDLCWHIPSLSMTPTIRGHLMLKGRKDVIDAEDPEGISQQDLREMAADLINTGVETDSSGIITHVLAVDYFLQERDFSTVIELAEAGMSLATELSNHIGKRMHKLLLQFEAALAVSLTYQDAPAHHRRALRLLDPILREEPDNTACHLARGYILAASERWNDALSAFNRVLALTVDDEDRTLEARGESAWCKVHLGAFDDAQNELRSILQALEAKGPEARDQRARVWWRLGTCYWEAGGESKSDPRHAYTAFINALKASPSLAPAFTSLGRYYLEVSSPPDHARASKCFQKAFELDPREDMAARLLADEFANDGEWDLVEVLARRVIAGANLQKSSERVVAGSALAIKHAWAWRAIGAAELNSHHYSAATHAFQSALRGASQNANTWLQLGLSYRGAGQFVAALKTFNRVLVLAPENWNARFCVGDVQRTLGLFDAAINTFEGLVSGEHGGALVQGILAETYLARGRESLTAGSRVRAERDLEAALKLGVKLIERGQTTRLAWKVVADVYSAFAELEELNVPEDGLDAIVRTLKEEHVDEKIGDALKPFATVQDVERSDIDLAAHFKCIAVVAHKMHVLLEIYGDNAGGAWYDLALAGFRHIHEVQSLRPDVTVEDLQRACVFCMRKALQQEPRNPIYWTALGAFALDLSPRLSQHALIKAAEISPRSAAAWTHLGLFYIEQDDLGLANEAFLKAQMTDPEFAPAWLGQAALASLNGDTSTADMLIEHAWLLGGPIDVALAFGVRVTNRNPSERSVDALFSLTRYLARRPRSNATALHAHGLLCERDGLLESACESLEAAVAALEANYERTEDPQMERRYALANANLARMYLCRSRYAEAVGCADGCMTLLEAEGDASRASWAQAAMVKGLANIGLGETTEGLALLESAAEAGSSKETLALAKTLWHSGDEAGREEAKGRLLANITDVHSGRPNLPTISSLGAAAILSNDDDLLDAAVGEVSHVATDQVAGLDPTRDVDELLVSHALLQNDVKAAAAIRSRAVAAEPKSAHARRQLASLLFRSGQKTSSLQVLLPTDTDAGSLRAILCGSVAEAQRAIHHRPWEASNWEALACAA